MIEPQNVFIGVAIAVVCLLWSRLIAAWKLERAFRESEATAIEQRDEALARIGHLETELSGAGGDMGRQQNELEALRRQVRELTQATLNAQTPETLGRILQNTHGPLSKLTIHLDVLNVTLPPTDDEIARYLNARGASIAILRARETGRLADIFIRTPQDWKRLTQTGTFELVAQGGFFSVGGIQGSNTAPIRTVETPAIEPSSIRRRLL